MSHFAKVENGIVTQVLVIEQDAVDSGTFGDPASFIQTSYNTHGGVHYGNDGQPDGGTPLRKNYAGTGDTYDVGRDAFYAPQPYPSWSLNETTCLWESPIPMPDDGNIYDWNEDQLNWILV